MILNVLSRCQMMLEQGNPRWMPSSEFRKTFNGDVIMVRMGMGLGRLLD